MNDHPVNSVPVVRFQYMAVYAPLKRSVQPEGVPIVTPATLISRMSLFWIPAGASRMISVSCSASEYIERNAISSTEPAIRLAVLESLVDDESSAATATETPSEESNSAAKLAVDGSNHPAGVAVRSKKPCGVFAIGAPRC